MNPLVRKMQKSLNSEIQERKRYLKQINDEIDLATENGAARLRDLVIEIDGCEREKARLLKQLLTLKQQIRELEVVKASQ